jgi:hypothetical protein
MEEQLLSKGPFHVDTFLLCLLIFEKRISLQLNFAKKVEPHVQSVWFLINAPVGRHPGQKMAHLSTGKGRGFSLPG